MPIHAPSSGIEQDRSVAAVACGAVDRSSYRGRQRDQNELRALADYAQYAVAVFLADVLGVGLAGLEDPQPEQFEHRDECEVELVGGIARRGEQCLEL